MRDTDEEQWGDAVAGEQSPPSLGNRLFLATALIIIAAFFLFNAPVAAPTEQFEIGVAPNTPRTPTVNGYPPIGEDGTYCHLVEWC